MLTMLISMLMGRKDRRGFSIMEIVIVIAIVALVAAAAVPGYFSMLHRGRANQQVRMFLDDVSAARQAAGTGKAMSISAGANVRSAGIRVLSASSYEIIQTDSPTGAGTGYTSTCSPAPCTDIIKIVTFSPESAIVFNTPSTFPTDIMFRSSGTLVPGAPTTIVLQDQYNSVLKTLQISMTGTVRVQN